MVLTVRKKCRLIFCKIFVCVKALHYACVCVCVAGDGCGHTVLGAESGSLASLGYPLFYPAHSVCEWEISGSAGHTLLLRVADLDIDTHNCQVSYLRLFDGIGAGRTEIGERGFLF